ncbi:MAG: hypothetical protein AAGI52_10305 [Bacteroidota bacterium]
MRPPFALVTRLPLAALALVLAACTPDLSLDEALDAAAAAEARAEPREAIRYYKLAADQGDLGAIKTVAASYRDGYLRAKGPDRPVHAGEETSSFMPLLVLPGQASHWQRRYERERDGRALAGDPSAWMRVAEDLTVWNRNETPADADSALAIRERLVREGYHPAILQKALSVFREDREAGLELFHQAEAAGSPGACQLRATWLHYQVGIESPAKPDPSANATAQFIDALEACPPVETGPDEPERGARLVANLAKAAASPSDTFGSADDAVASLDSLRALGVFDRHPRLTAFLGEAATETTSES